MVKPGVTYENGEYVIHIVKYIGQKRTMTLEIYNNDMSPTAVGNAYGVTPLTVTMAGYEGLHLGVYKCQAGVDTIGFGQTGQIKEHVGLFEAFSNLRDDIADHSSLLSQRYKSSWSNLSPETQGALTNLSFNAGTFGKTLSNAIRSGDTDAIAQAMQDYNKYKDPKTKEYKVSKGLVARRANDKDIIHGNMDKVWQRNINYYDFLGDLLHHGASFEDIGKIMDGIAKVEVSREGSLLYTNSPDKPINRPEPLTPALSTPAPIVQHSTPQPTDRMALLAAKPEVVTGVASTVSKIAQAPVAVKPEPTKPETAKVETKAPTPKPEVAKAETKPVPAEVKPPVKHEVAKAVAAVHAQHPASVKKPELTEMQKKFLDAYNNGPQPKHETAKQPGTKVQLKSFIGPDIPQQPKNEEVQGGFHKQRGGFQPPVKSPNNSASIERPSPGEQLNNLPKPPTTPGRNI